MILHLKNILHPFVLVIVLNSFVWPKTYYVNATTGNDLQSGTSASDAWKTVNKVNSTHLDPGDRILFNYGDVWREELVISSPGTMTAPITFGAYGDANRAKPEINGADIILEWTEYKRDLWRTNMAEETFGVWFDNELGNNVSSQYDLKNEHDWIWENKLLYIFSKGNPGKKYTTPGIEAAQRKSCINDANENCSYVIIENFKVRHSGAINSFYGAIDCRDGWGQQWIIRNCHIADIAGLGIMLLYIDSLVENNVVERTELGAILVHSANNGSSIIGNDISFCYSGVSTYGNHITISGNKIHHNDLNGILIWHEFDTANCTDIRVTQNEIYENGQSWQKWLTLPASEKDGTQMDGIWASNMDNSVIAYNLVYNNSHGHGIHLDDGSENNLIANNTICGHLDNGLIRYSAGIVVENGQDAKTGKFEISRNNIVKNNICLNNHMQFAFAGTEKVTNDDEYGSNSVNNNNFWLGTKGKLIARERDSGDHFTLLTWQQATGQDAQSISADPLFASDNPSKAVDFKLRPDSPCINAGIDVGLSRDFFGAPISSHPEMGISEFSTSSDTEPPSQPRSVSLPTYLWNESGPF